MNLRKITMLVVLLVLTSCSNKNDTQVTQQDASDKKTGIEGIIESEPIQPSKFINSFVNASVGLISKKDYVSFDDLQMQKLKNIEENSEVIISSETPEKMSGNEMYFYLKERTLVVGKAFKGQYDSTGLTLASAYVIHEDGIIATNYHVIEVVEKMESIGVFVTDVKGNVYPVTNILSSSQSNDLAILKIDTKGKKLKSIPFAQEELMGETIYMMGHPFNNFYFMSKGNIAHKFISDRDDSIKIAITAEFGQGASGGPIVNEKGQLVAMVSATMMHYTNGSREFGSLQFIHKEAIPVSVIEEYIKRD